MCVLNGTSGHRSLVAGLDYLTVNHALALCVGNTGRGCSTGSPICQTAVPRYYTDSSCQKTPERPDVRRGGPTNKTIDPAKRPFYSFGRYLSARNSPEQYTGFLVKQTRIRANGQRSFVRGSRYRNVVIVCDEDDFPN